MKIIIPVTTNDTNSTINTTLGRCPFFLCIDSETLERTYIENTAKDAKGGAGIKAAQLMLDNGIDVLITPRSGTNALDVLTNANVQIVESIGSDISANLNLFFDGKLSPLTEGHAGYHHA